MNDREAYLQRRDMLLLQDELEARIKELEALYKFHSEENWRLRGLLDTAKVIEREAVFEARITELEADYHAERIRADKLFDECLRLREAGATIISAIRFGLSQDELEAMEEFELLLGGGENE